MNLKKEIGKVLTSKSVGNGPSSCEKRIYRAAVSQRLRNNGIQNATKITHTLCSGFKKSVQILYSTRSEKFTFRQM